VGSQHNGANQLITSHFFFDPEVLKRGSIEAATQSPTETISAAVPVGQRHTITHVGAIAVQEPLLLPIAEQIMPRPSYLERLSSCGSRALQIGGLIPPQGH
jgi:hypothetical protein